MIPLALVVTAAALTAGLPRLMARQEMLRRTPRAALLAWQSVTLGGILATIAIAPAIVPMVLFDGQTVGQHFMLLVIGVSISGLMLGRLLVAGHRIGTRMRVLRARHRELVDIIARHSPDDDRLRVLEHPAPTAYCLPGREPRLVLSQGVIDGLNQDQLRAVLAHEERHLRSRHDLLVEFFSVIHETVPEGVRCPTAMREVRLLVEILADRASVRRVGTDATVEALFALSGSRTPDAAMGHGNSLAPTRVAILQAGPASPALTAAIYGYAAAALLTPVALMAALWT